MLNLNKISSGKPTTHPRVEKIWNISVPKRFPSGDKKNQKLSFITVSYGHNIPYLYVTRKPVTGCITL